MKRCYVKNGVTYVRMYIFASTCFDVSTRTGILHDGSRSTGNEVDELQLEAIYEHMPLLTIVVLAVTGLYGRMHVNQSSSRGHIKVN